jgi:hypothetical protein
MIKYKEFLIGILFLAACSSGKRVIGTAEAFIITQQFGTVAVDEKGNEVTPGNSTVLVMYIQTRSTDVKWDSVWLNNKPYGVMTQTEIKQPFEAGFDNTTGEKIMIQPAAGFYLYQLTVAPQMTKGSEWPASLTLRTWYRNKPLMKEIKPLKTLRPYDAQ